MSVLRELLNVYWLRPETALWRAVDIEVMKDFKITGNSLDLGCGDGILSFIRAGGKFDINFDDYQSIGNLDKFFQNYDIHDKFTPQYSPKIIKNTRYKFTTALDHKKNLISKARKLEFYEQHFVHDANKNLPFEENSFNSIFSNIVYWLDDPQKSINEIARVLQKGSGRVALMLPNSSMPTFSFYNTFYANINNSEFSFLKYLDRGRHASNIKVAKNYLEWKAIIDKSGLKIVDHKMHLSKSLIQMWDIGLRPLFPVLIKMINAINEEKKIIEIKLEWIKTFMKFLEPVFELEMKNKLDQDVEKAFHYFVLEK